MSGGPTRLGRPKVYDTERVSTALRIPVDLHGAIKAAADERDVSANWLMVRLLADGMDRLAPLAALYPEAQS